MVSTWLQQSSTEPGHFAQFYEEQVGVVTRFFASRVLDAEAALDLSAETFAQAYAGRRKFRGRTEEEARAWLFTIARRQLASYLRKGYASRAAMERLGLTRPEAEPEELGRVEELGDMAQHRAAVARHMGELPEGLRAAVTLRVVEQLSYQEVAARLAITESTARMRVSRALRILRRALSPQIPEEHYS